VSDCLQIDGSFGEGGGQILRTSVSLSAITGRAIEIVNIRAGRSKPGLQAQHLASVRAAAQICGAELRGDATGSVYLEFVPMHDVRAGEYRFDIGTAGATTLVAQTVLLPLALAGSPSSVIIRGGTHNPMAPTADYLEHVYNSVLEEAGYRVAASYGPPGFYPRGGGELRLEIGSTQERSPFAYLEHEEKELVAYIVTSRLDPSVAERAERTIQSREPMRVVKRVEDGPGTGAAVTIVSGAAGFTSLGERGKPMEKVAGEAVDQLIAWRLASAGVDEHLADQLVLPSLFAKGTSVWQTTRVTEHLRTVLWLVGKFCPVDWDLDERRGMVRLSP
jgi:RNA 3'-terminal phosphate cyclase (ATP)